MTVDVDTLPGIEARTVTTSRLRTRVLVRQPLAPGAPAGKPGHPVVLFLHGNLSSATWWEETMLSLPPEYAAYAPDQRGFGGADPDVFVDATRGLGDLVDDAVALLDHLGVARVHVVGSSMGGSVVWQLLMAHPARFLSATQVAAGSPYGFCGCRGIDGQPTCPDVAGSGAGLVRPELIDRIRAGDATMDSRFTPRSALRALVVKAPFVPAREDALVASMLSTHVGDRAVPGDAVASEHWPYFAPGRWGIYNALSPRFAGDPARLATIEPKVPILWLRGSDDMAVSDTSASDPAVRGAMGIIDQYPGAEIYPGQPMVSQIRAVLDGYRQAGGQYREVVLDDVGHAPYVEALDRFNAEFHPFLAGSR